MRWEGQPLKLSVEVGTGGARADGEGHRSTSGTPQDAARNACWRRVRSASMGKETESIDSEEGGSSRISDTKTVWSDGKGNNSPTARLGPPPLNYRGRGQWQI